MMSLSDYSPPLDAAGGFLVIQYSNGVDTHRMRVHIAQFSPTVLTSGQGGGATVDYAYNAGGPGTEANIGTTFAALMAVIKGGWVAGWTFSVYELYQIVNHVPVLMPSTPNPTAVDGTNSNTPSTNDRFFEEIFSMRTTLGNRARFIRIGISGGSLGVAATNAQTHPIVGYLTGTGTQIVAHDGSKMLSPAHTTYAQNRRLRRHYGQA